MSSADWFRKNGGRQRISNPTRNSGFAEIPDAWPIFLAILPLRSSSFFLQFNDLVGVVAQFDRFSPGNFGLFESLCFEVEVTDMLVYRGIGT